MADRTGEALTVDFDRRLLLQLRGSAIISDAGLLAYRDLDDALNLTDTAAGTPADVRSGKNGRHRLAGMLRQSSFGRLAKGPPTGTATSSRTGRSSWPRRQSH